MARETRAQGRPPRGDSEVGRERLLDRTRYALRGKPKIDLQRSEIALSAGVTPALVTYYYRDKWDLFAAAAEPVIDAYVADLRSILRSDASIPAKARSLVELFIEVNFHHGYLLDFCSANDEKMVRYICFGELRDTNTEVLDFFGQLLQRGLVRGSDPGFIHASLWGLCKHLAQMPRVVHFNAPSDKRQAHPSADHVFDLFFNGAAAPGFVDDDPTPATAPPAAASRLHGEPRPCRRA